MVSVIIPTYNRPHLIRASLDSILNQTIQDLEIIVVDGSTNRATRQEIDRIRDERIRYEGIKNRSAACSRNIGLRMARGELIAFNDDDDIWMPRKLERQIHFLKRHKRCRICFTSFKKEKKRGARIIPAGMETGCGPIFPGLLLGNFVGLPTVLLDQNVLNGTGFDEGLACLEDWDFMLSLARMHPVGFLNEVLVIARDTPGSVNKAPHPLKAEAYLKIYLKYLPQIQKDRRAEAKHLLSIGSNLCLMGDMQGGKRYLRKAVSLRPLSPILWLALICAYAGRSMYRHSFHFYEKISNNEP